MQNEFPEIFANAAGWVRDRGEVRRLCNTPLTHIVVGSFTPERREGNLGGTAFHVDEHGTSANSMGLPNAGIDSLIEMLPDMLKMAEDAEKTLVVSIAASSISGYIEPLVGLYAAGVRLIEVNCGCPNVYSEGKHHPILSFQPKALVVLLSNLEMVMKRLGDMRYWLKVSPSADPELRRQHVKNLVWAPRCDAIVATNTFPNYRPIDDDGKPRLGVTGGYGGMAGTALKPISLLCAADYVHLQKGEARQIPVIGCGGISNAKDVADYHRVGCRGVEIGTAYFEKGNARIFQDIVRDWVDG